MALGASKVTGPKAGSVVAPKSAAAKPKGGLAAAKPRSVRQFLRAISREKAAKYIVRVNKCVQVWAQPKAVDDERPQPTPEELRSAKPAFKKQDAFSYEVEVIETDHPEISAGSMYSVTTNDKYPDSYYSDIKGFLCAVLNAEPEDVGNDEWQAAYQPDQPHAGAIIHLTVHEQGNRSNEGTFTKILPRALDEDEVATLKEEHPELF